MRSLGFIVAFMMIVSCYAVQIVTINNSFREQQTESLKRKEILSHQLPIQSKARSGHVPRHTVAFSGFANTIFIIGDDPFSKHWLQEHTEELQKCHAIGFITNIKNAETLSTLQTVSGLPLLPSNVDDLMEILGEHHYPLIFNKGIVWQ